MTGRVRVVPVDRVGPGCPAAHESLPAGIDFIERRDGRRGAEPAPGVRVPHTDAHRGGRCRRLLNALLARHPELFAGQLQRLLFEHGCCYSLTTILLARRRLQDAKAIEPGRQP